MDTVSIILISIFTILFLALLVFLGARSEPERKAERKYFREIENARKGKIGENKIAMLLEKCAQPSTKIINDIVLYNDKSCGSSQIDHIFISEIGIYVIETKSRAGTIYGDNYKKEWTQILANGKIQHTFHSPVLQNNTHVLLIKRILKNAYPIQGFVVFVEGNTQNIDSDCVLTPNELITFLRNSYMKNLTQEEILDAYKKICDYQKKYPVSQAEHSINIKNNRN